MSGSTQGDEAQGDRARGVQAQGDHLIALNAYYLQEEATRWVRQQPKLDERACPPVLEEVFAKAKRLGATIVRTNGHNDDVDKAGDTAMQVDNMVFDEVAFRGLDKVLCCAHQHKIRLILTLGNYWDAYGGARQYVAWANLPNPRRGDARFFVERSVIDHYKAYIEALLRRENHCDGIRYGEHPAVFAWELLNEPRGRGLDDDGTKMRRWIDEISAHIRTLAPDHLIGTGEEGFESSIEGYDEDFWRRDARADWMFRTASSFDMNTASPDIDYASVHMYPEAWNFEPRFIAAAGCRWITAHQSIAAAHGKPLVVGEFGLRNRDGMVPDLDVRRDIYRCWFSCARRAGARVMAPWMFAYDARPDWDLYTFYLKDGTEFEDPANRYAGVIRDAARAVR